MVDTPSERRLAENEVIFRKLNEKFKNGVIATNRLADEDNQPEFRIDDPLAFYCECADEQCAAKISADVSEYEKIHASRDQFIVLPGHEVLSVENVVSKRPRYLVVKKKTRPPENSDTLKPTAVSNK
jgi:hypothetical protein